MLSAACALMMTGCADDDVYSPDTVVETTTAEYEANWEDLFGTTDEDQDWNMAEQATAVMTIYEDALTTYSLQLYTANPLTDDDAMLLASYDVTTDDDGYATTSFTVDIPANSDTLYAARMDKHNQRLVQLALVDDGTVNVRFGVAASSTRAGNDNSENEYYIPTYSEYAPYASEDDVMTLIADATEFETWDQDYSTWPTPSNIWDNDVQYSTKIVMTVGSGETKNMGAFYAWGTIEELYIVVEDGGTLTTSTNSIYTTNDATGKTITYQIIVLGGGSFEVSSSSALQMGYAQLVVFEGGTVTGTGLNTGSTYISGSSLGGYMDGIFNAGTIEVTTLSQSQSNIHNNGIINVTTYNTPNGGIIVNNGRVYCETYGSTSDQGGQIWTNCLFRCKDYCKGSDFIIGANAAIEADEIEVYDSLRLNKNAILRAWTELLLGNCALCGPHDSNYGLVSAPELYPFDNMATSGDISGNVYIEYDTIARSSAEYWDNVMHEYVAKNNADGYGALITTVGGAPLSIAGDDTELDITEASCSGMGNDGAEDTEVDITPMTWTIACEDLGDTDDYDFNDIVFSVTHVAGETTAYVTPRAAGGVMEATINFDGDELGEVHDMLSASSDVQWLEGYSLPMYNTSSGGEAGQTIEVDVDDEFTMADDMGGFSLTVNGDEITTTITPPAAGSAPQMLCIQGEWLWPGERESIADAYPDFGAWNGDVSETGWTDNTGGTVLGNY